MVVQLLRYARDVAHVVAMCITVASIVLCTSQVVCAQNLAFMPGDAYFIFLFSEELVDVLPDKGGTVDLPYHTVLVPFGGFHAGFEHLRIQGVTPQFVQNLRRAYRDHRVHVPKIVSKRIMEDGHPHETEMNPPIGFVYNRDVDWSDQRLALKYNEVWPHLPAEAFAGPDRDLLGKGRQGAAVSYVSLVKTYDAVVEDWGNAARFRPLAAQVPKDVAWGKWGKPIEDPVVVQNNDVQVVVTTQEDLKACFLQKPQARFYQVSRDAISVCRWVSEGGSVKVIKEELGSRQR
jgi:hypothetical protein